MRNQDSDQGIGSNLYTLWPGYLLRYGGFLLALFSTGLGYVIGKQVITAAGFILLAGTFFLFWAARWVKNRRYGTDQQKIIESLFAMSQVQPDDMLAYIDLGLRASAVTLSHHLTTGQLVVIDVFNPQLTAGKELRRARQQAPPVAADPRLDWFDGRIDLLPLPDSAVSAIFLPMVLSEFNQHGDRQSLLREVNRILRPNGRLLIAEQNTSWLNWLSLDPGSSKLQPFSYWQRLLSQAGFKLLRHENLQDLIICMRADKPSPFAGKQLSLDLHFQQSK